MTQLSHLTLAFLALVIAGRTAAQPTYPEKPIRLVTGFPVGSSPDIVARVLAQKFTEALAKPVMVDNVSGAAGNIGADRVAKAPPDGYTLALAVNAQIIMNPSLYKLPFDPVRDFAPISQVGMSWNLLVVNNSVPAKTFQELVTLAKAQPGTLTFASAGAGSSPHLAAELLKSMGGLDIRHVPYKGVVSAIPDLLGARVTMMFSPIATVLPLVRDGRLRALAVTSPKRSSAVPDLPTISESGLPGFDVTLWYGLLAPAATPGAIVRKVHLETVKALALDDVRSKFADIGVEVVGNSPAEFASTIKSEIPRWAKMIREWGIKPD